MPQEGELRNFVTILQCVRMGHIERQIMRKQSNQVSAANRANTRVWRIRFPFWNRGHGQMGYLVVVLLSAICAAFCSAADKTQTAASKGSVAETNASSGAFLNAYES